MTMVVVLTSSTSFDTLVDFGKCFDPVKSGIFKNFCGDQVEC